MATIRDKRPGVQEVRAFTGSDTRSSPTQLSRAATGRFGHSNPRMTLSVYSHAFAAGLGDILKGDAK